MMNTSFDRLALVNTYGAFGSVGRLRPEIVFEGTRDASPDDDERLAAPTSSPASRATSLRRPCVVAPYQYRLDWQIWFAAMSTPERYPWTLHLVWKLLHNDRGALSLLANDPVPGGAAALDSARVSTATSSRRRTRPARLVDAHARRRVAAAALGERPAAAAVSRGTRVGACRSRSTRFD